ncbi:MAG: methionine--tRNA ligase [Oscillospiraceae bacterium]|nr:methionine--tRNA ligase [Oscillospiraceae bacterium]
MAEKKTYYITTPIYYPSDNLHIGHSYTTTACDSLARYKRLQGYDVMYLTGTDEHGQKIQDKAAAAGKTPKQYVDDIVNNNVKPLWKRLNIRYDRFIRTTDDYHVEAIQKIFKELYDKGDIYKGKYEGWYCKPCETFWTESQLVDGKCPDCGRDVYKASEEAYFFRLSNYADKLLKYYEDHPDFIQPEARKNEMIAFINQGLQDLCVSRTTVKWGIPVDFDPDHTVYVWVDALFNYCTALGYKNSEYNDYDRYWPRDLHMVGKEILRFHTIIWPALLMAMDVPIPKRVFGHGWLLINGGKMSKSVGNVVDPFVLCDRYGVDAVRYYLLREVPFGNDGSFTNESLISRINADLANDLGNLVSRTVAMIDKYFGGQLPADREYDPLDNDLKELCEGLRDKCDRFMDSLSIPQALAEIFKIAQRANKYIDETAPWTLAKDEAKKARLATVLYNLVESLRFVTALLVAYLPETAPKIAAQLGYTEDDLKYENLDRFGYKKDVKVTKGEVIFPRIDVAKELAELEKQDAEKKARALRAAKAKEEAEKKAAEEEDAGIISIDEFRKVRLIVAEIRDSVEVENSRKLLDNTIFDGKRERHILSGIREWYSPEDMKGKKVIIVDNLAPRKMAGKLSEGMLVAGEGEDGSAKVIFLGDEFKPGMKLR